MKVEERRQSVPEGADPAEVFRHLERRDWELWSIALLLLTVFAGGLLADFYHRTTEARLLSPLVARFLWVALFGLIALVVLLNIYLIVRRRALLQLWRRHLLQQQESEQEREQAMLDPLTQLYSRRFFDDMIPKEVCRSERTGRPLSFLLLDLDGFKKINQELGHFVGDEVLRGVAALLRDTLRASDYSFRFGGDELLAVLPDTPAEGVAEVAARLQKKLAARADLAQRIGRPLTVTIGQATYIRGGSLEAVVEEVERALDAARAGAATRATPS